MGYIGNAPFGGTVGTDNIQDSAIQTADIADSAVTSAKLSTTGVTAGSYTLSNLTVDAKGRITSASSNTAGTGISISSGTISTTITQYTDALARAAVSVTDSGGDGSLSYNNTTGVITYTGPSATEVRAHFSASTGITITNGAIATTITQYTDALARAAVSVTDSGGDGSLSYDNTTGVFTYTGPSATEVRAHFSAGTGVTITNGQIAIAQAVGSGDSPSFTNMTLSGYLRGPATFTIDPAAHGDNTGTVVIAGNLQVDGTTTTVNSTTLSVDDLNITLADGAANAAAADGAGITVAGANATINYTSATDTWDLNKSLTVNSSSIFLANTGNVISTVQSTSTSGSRSATLRLNVANTGGDDPAGVIAFTYGTGFTASSSIEATSTPNILKFLIGTTEGLRLTSTGLGIGLGGSSPSYRLDVSGVSRLGLNVTQTAPSSTDILSTAHVAISGTGGNYLTIGQYGGAESQAIWMQSSYLNPTTATYNLVLQPLGGNVGIGVSNPSTRLDIGGGYALGFGSNLYGVINNFVYPGISGGAGGLLFANKNYAAAAVGLGFNNAGTYEAVLTARPDSNVGIGTTYPNNTLEIRKDTTTAGSAPTIFLNNRATGNSGYYAGGLWSGAYRDVKDPGYIAGIDFYRNPAAGGLSSLGEIRFYTGEGETLANLRASNERARFTGNGVFQVGTTQTTEASNIAMFGTMTGNSPGTVRIGSNDQNNAALSLTNWDGATATNGVRISFDNSGHGAFEIGGSSNSNNFDICRTWGTPDLRITSGGNLLVGSSSNAAGDPKLFVNGNFSLNGGNSIYWDGTLRNATFTVDYDGSLDRLTIGSSANTGNTVGSYIRFLTGPSNSYAERARISSAGGFSVGTQADPGLGAIYATGDITAFYSSDIKFKTNIRNIPNALSTVQHIGGKLFTWTDEYIESRGGKDNYFTQQEDFGVIAQDVQAVFPTAVRTRLDGSLAVDYPKLAALAFAAIVELAERVKKLEDKK